MTLREQIVARMAELCIEEELFTPNKEHLTALIVDDSELNGLWRLRYGIEAPHAQSNHISNRLLYDVAKIVNPEWEMILRDSMESGNVRPRTKGLRNRKRHTKRELQERKNAARKIVLKHRFEKLFGKESDDG